MTERKTLLAVYVEKFEPTSPDTAKQDGDNKKRLAVATELFPPGTTANAVCERVMKKYSTSNMGLWLLQIKLPEEDSQGENGYKTIKDSKYKLTEGEEYHVVHFTGSGMFLYS